MECEAAEQRVRHARKPPKERKRTTREWERRNPKRFARQKLRRRLRNAGVPEALLAETVKRYEQTDACECCSRPVSEIGTLHADHCHTSGQPRGFLCSTCNTGLGQFGDDPERLRAAIRYLKRHGHGK